MTREAKGRGAPASRAPGPVAPPFSRPFAVDELLRRPDEPVTVSADPDERAALAAADGVPAIGALEAEFTAAREGRNVRVKGEVRARVTQDCVVTLEPFEAVIVEPVDVRFAFAAPAPAPEPRAGERMSRRRAAQAKPERRAPPAAEFAAHDEEDPPDPIVDGKIDLGALAAEFMALALDPYPRKPGATFAPVEEAAERDPSPFAGLAKLKKDQ